MTLRARLKCAPLLGFFAVAFAWSWACWALSPTIRTPLPWLATLLVGLGLTTERLLCRRQSRATNVN